MAAMKCSSETLPPPSSPPPAPPSPHVPPPHVPPPVPPVAPPLAPPVNILLVRATQMSKYAAEAQVNWNTVTATGAGTLNDITTWGWSAMNTWPNSGYLEMRCFGGMFNPPEVISGYYSLSDDYQLNWGRRGTDGPVTEHTSYWDGCMPGGTTGNKLTTVDADNDAWNGGNCATYDGYADDHWPYESQGWGWHNSCHSCGLWDRLGAPVCFGYYPGSPSECWSAGQNCKADRVELWYKHQP